MLIICTDVELRSSCSGNVCKIVIVKYIIDFFFYLKKIEEESGKTFVDVDVLEEHAKHSSGQIK